MQKFLALICLGLLVSVASAGCASGRYGDCSCTSDVDGLISSAGITGFTASCTNRVWTITGAGSFNIANANWKINTDLIQLGANLNATGATLAFTLNAVNSSQSGYLNVQGSAILNSFFNFVLGDWNRAVDKPTLKVPFIRYVNTGGNPPTAYAPSLNSQDRFCWDVVPGAVVSANTSGFMSLEVALNKKGGSNCGGPSDRGWVVAMIVILILWGAGLGLFALITCKIDSCYSMWWALK